MTTIQNPMRIELNDNNFYYYRLLLTHTKPCIFVKFFSYIVYVDLIFLSPSLESYEKYVRQLLLTKPTCNTKQNKKNTHDE